MKNILLTILAILSICYFGQTQTLYVPGGTIGNNTANNYIGIGTGTPQFNLDVLGSGQRIMNSGSTGYTTFRLYNDQNNPFRALEIDYSGSAYPSSLITGSPSGEGASIATTGSFPISFGTNNISRMTIIPNGNVGIGTISPGLTTHVLGALGFPATSGASQTGVLRLQGVGSNGVLDFSVNAGSGASLQVTNQTDLSQKYPLILNPNGGNVGIGTPTPSTKLEVNGALRIDGATGGVVGTGTGSRIELSSGGITSIEENWGINLVGNDASPVKIGNAALLVGYTSGSAGWGTGGNLLVQGNVGIGTTTPDAKLAVSGQVHAQEVKVSVTVPGPDYVFEKDYPLTSLEDIKIYIDQNKHLPEVPSAKEMEKNGVQLGEMNMLLLKKIEELTLYVIELKKENEIATEQMKSMQLSIDHLTKEK